MNERVDEWNRNLDGTMNPPDALTVTNENGVPVLRHYFNSISGWWTLDFIEPMTGDVIFRADQGGVWRVIDNELTRIM